MKKTRAPQFFSLWRSFKANCEKSISHLYSVERIFKIRLFSLCIYFLSICFIICWWSLTLHPFTLPSPLLSRYSEPVEIDTSLLHAAIREKLSPLHRAKIERALSGHFPSMGELIEQWQREADLLRHLQGVQKLTPDTLYQARMIRSLLELNDKEKERLNQTLSLASIADDCGRWVSIPKKSVRCLPQSYLAAHFLLAIAKPSEILALPKGLRQLRALYPQALGEKIPLNVEEMKSEALSALKPDIAFIATYSHPPTLEMMKRLGIPLYSLHFIRSFEEIQHALLRVGHVSHHVLEAQLLAIFMQAAFLAMDNRLLALHHSSTPKNSKTKCLFLSLHEQFTLPSKRSLTGQLITRALKQCPSLETTLASDSLVTPLLGSTPFGLEQIALSDPDFLILSTNQKHLTAIPPMLETKKDGKPRAIFWVDEAIQNSPTQYLVLAYVDLYLAIASGKNRPIAPLSHAPQNFFTP